jgi:hypothetical protein
VWQHSQCKTPAFGNVLLLLIPNNEIAAVCCCLAILLLLPLLFHVTVPVQVGQCFTILARPQGSLAAGKIANVLKFKVKEIDPSSGEAEEDGYEDEYQVGTCYFGGVCCAALISPPSI